MLNIEFGAMALPIALQVKGLKRPAMASFQRSADAIVRLHIHGLLKESEVEKARKRLAKEIAREVKAC